MRKQRPITIILTMAIALYGQLAIAQGIQGGAIKASEQAIIAAPKSGRIISDALKIGDIVKKGSALIRLNCEQEQAASVKYQAQHSSAAQNRKLRQSEYDNGVGTSEELSVAKASVNETWAAVKEVKVSIANCAVSSPISGEVVYIFKGTGEWVQQGEPVLEISNNNTLYAEINVLENNWTNYEKGKPIVLRVIATGQTIEATVQNRANKIDLVSHTFAVQASLNETKGLAPGMAVTVN